MAQNDLIVRLGLDPNDFNSGIQATRKSISELGDKAKNELIDIADRFKKTSESTAPLTKKIHAMKKYMEMLATSQEGQTAEGQAMYEKLAQAAQEYSATLRKIQDDARGAADSVSGLEAPAQSLSERIKDIKQQMEQLVISEQINTKEGKEMYDKLAAQCQQYDRSLRQIQNDGRAMGVTLSDKVKEIKAKMEELILTDKINTDEGKKMWDQLTKEAQEYNDKIREINQSTARTTASAPVSAPGKKINVKEIAGDVLGKAGLGSLAPAVAGAMNPATLAVGALAGTMIAAGKASADFGTHLNSLQALTGLTDKEMKTLSNSAKQMSGQFSIDAGDIVDGMKLIGSQAPELLKDSKALSEVTEAANVLAKAAEIDVTDAASAITGTMNQMGASASEAKDIINTFAAASQQGTADVAYLNTVFEKSGTSASDAGMDYVQLAAAIEAIAPKFKSADEAGTKIAGTLLKLSVSGKSEFTPAVVGMSKALENLANAGLSNEEMLKLVGEGNLKMLQSLIENREQFNAYSESLVGTNTAYEQMAVNMKGWNAMIDKAKTTWQNFLIALGDSIILQNLMDNIGYLIDFVSEFVAIVGDIVEAFATWEDQTEDGTEAFNLYKEQLNALITVIGYVGDAIEIVIALIGKLIGWIREFANWVKTCTDESKKQWDSFVQTLSDDSFLKSLLGFFKQIAAKFREMVNGMKQVWNDLMDFLGLDKKKVTIEGEKKEKVSQEKTEKKKTSTSKTTVSTDTEKKSKKTKSSKTEKIDYLVSVDDSSLDTAEKKLQAWQNKRKTIKIDDVQGLKECNEQIKKWQDEVQKRKLIIEVGNDVYDNLDKLQAKLAELEDIKTMMVGVDFDAATDELTEFINELNALNNSTVSVDVELSRSPEKLDAEIKEVKDKILIETIKVGFKPEIENGSKAYLENEIKKLEDAKTILFNTTADPKTIKRVDDEIKNLKEKLEAEDIRLGLTPEIKKGSLKFIRRAIKRKEDEIELALNTNIDPKSMKKLQDELKRLRDEEEAKAIEIGLKFKMLGSDYLPDDDPIKSKRENKSSGQKRFDQIRDDYNNGLIGLDDAVSHINNLNDELKSMDLPPINFKVNGKGEILTAQEALEGLKSTFDNVAGGVSTLAGVFTSVGNAIDSTAGKWVAFAGQSINATAQIITQVVSLIAAKEAESIAAGTASAMGSGFPACIPALATILAAIAGVFTSLPKFETGGIVGGSSFTGDKLLARVNSGEMILNKKQQQNLYNSMSYAEVGTPMQNTLKGDVTFSISGAALKGTLKNYDSKMSKIK